MLPSPFVEWLAWSSLCKHKSHELILLKGHLFLELLLADLLVRQHSITAKSVKKMSFYRKLEIFEYVSVNIDNSQAYAIALARELNALRNELAHEILFDNEAKLQVWATTVLEELPSIKFQRWTPRTKLIHAISAVAATIYGQYEVR